MANLKAVLRLLVGTGFAVAMLTEPASAQGRRRFEATVVQLEPIARAAVDLLSPGAEKLPGFSLETEGQPADQGGYYLFDAEWSGPPHAINGHIAGIFVNKYDGDVWDGSFCRRINSRKISAERDRLFYFFAKKRRSVLHKSPACYG